MKLCPSCDSDGAPASPRRLLQRLASVGYYGYLDRAHWWARRLLVWLFAPTEWRWRRRRFVGFFVRGWRGWADHDCWGVDTYLAGVMAGMLRRLADHHHHGVPPAFLPDVGACPNYDADAAWTAWLRDKATWLEWYHRDEDGVSDDRGWIRPDLTDTEKALRINAHVEKMRSFHEDVMPDLGRHFGSLWD